MLADIKRQPAQLALQQIQLLTLFRRYRIIDLGGPEIVTQLPALNLDVYDRAPILLQLFIPFAYKYIITYVHGPERLISRSPDGWLARAFVSSNFHMRLSSELKNIYWNFLIEEAASIQLERYMQPLRYFMDNSPPYATALVETVKRMMRDTREIYSLKQANTARYFDMRIQANPDFVLPNLDTDRRNGKFIFAPA